MPRPRLIVSRLLDGLSWLLLVPALGVLVLLVPAYLLAAARGMGPKGRYPSALQQPMLYGAIGLGAALLLMGVAALLRPRADHGAADPDA